MDENKHVKENYDLSISFKTVANKILNFLHERLGFQLWAITRVQGDHWIMLVNKDSGYDIEGRNVFVWSDSFCSRMVQSLGPKIAPRVKDIPAYTDAPINKELPISAYIGIPLKSEDGRLFGTLCAIDPAEKLESLKDELPLLNLFGEIISKIIQADMKTQKLIIDLELTKLNMDKDPVTDLYNNEAWDKLLTKEQERCDAFGSPALILIIKADNTNKNAELLKDISGYIKNSFRLSDIKAYLGHNTFAILAIEIDNDLTNEFISRIRNKLNSKKMPVKIGWAQHDPRNTLIETQAQAEKKISPLQ